MSIERKKDEKGNLIFGVGNRDFLIKERLKLKIMNLRKKRLKRKKLKKLI